MLSRLISRFASSLTQDRWEPLGPCMRGLRVGAKLGFCKGLTNSSARKKIELPQKVRYRQKKIAKLQLNAGFGSAQAVLCSYWP